MSAYASDSQAYQLDAYPSGSVSSTGSSSATSGASSNPTTTSATSSSANWTRPTIGQSSGAASSAPSPIVTPPLSSPVVANSPPISPVVPEAPKGKWRKCRTSCCSLNRYTAIAALIIAVLVAYPSFKSWEISKWTARKDFFLYCRENISSLRGADLQPCQAAIDAGLSAPPRLLVRHAGQAEQNSRRGNRDSFDLDGRMNVHGSNQSLVMPSITPSQSTPVPPKSIEKTIAILTLTFLAYYFVVILAAYAIRRHRSAMLEWKWVRSVRQARPFNRISDSHLFTVNWSVVFYSCVSLGVFAPAGMLVYESSSLLREKKSALQVYLEYCKTVKEDDKAFGQCSTALHKSEDADRHDKTEWSNEAVIALISIIISIATMAIALFSTWRRGMRKRSDGYKEVQYREIDLETFELTGDTSNNFGSR